MDQFEFLIFLKKQYQKLLQTQYDIILQVEEIEIMENNLDQQPIHSHHHVIKQNAEIMITFAKNIIDTLQQNIMKDCQHTFLNDAIDIHPDKSQCITYCSKCEYTWQ